MNLKAESPKDCEGNKTQFQCLRESAVCCKADVLCCVYNSSRSFLPEIIRCRAGRMAALFAETLLEVC